jgi:hypothetical protein
MLDHQFFWGQKGKSRSRFNLLLLEYGEYFFEDLSVCLSQISATPDIKHDLSRIELRDHNSMQIQGRLKVCSRSLIFEPNDIKKPVQKFPFKGMTSDIIEISSDSSLSNNVLTFSLNNYYEMKANNVVGPYKFVEVTCNDDCHKSMIGSPISPSSNRSSSNNTGTSSKFSSGTDINGNIDEPIRIIISLVHSDIKEIVQKVEHLRKIFLESEQTSGVADQLLSPYITSATANAFDSSQLIDFHEKLLLSDAITVKRIKPLIQNPGLFMITEAHVYFQPSQLNNIGEKMQCIILSKVSRIYCRRYLLRQTGLEFLMIDGNSTLFVFSSSSLRDKVYKILISSNIKLSTTEKDNDIGSYRSGITLDSITRKWQNREMSTFDYLMYLNNEADRSVNDLTQYPVFPHIIADYESDKLDLEDPDTFRDLTKPIGALNDKRLEHFKERFESMPDADPDLGLPPPFLYGTHYSTPGYVLHYLVRVAPEFMLCLQNGKFDAPDRMFYSMKDTWESCLQNPTDLKELIPEFFCGTGDFLNNSDDLDLGRRQTGDRVDSVDLPSWSKRPQDFIRKHRKALESDYVSENIHHWIDLIFGYKQKGDAAVEANNLYYYLTYEGSVDLEEEHDERRRAALEIQIQEFGQTPKQLFVGSHPSRNDFGANIELCDNININTLIEKQLEKEDRAAADAKEEDLREQEEMPRGSGIGSHHHDEDLLTNVVTLGADFHAEVAELEERISNKDIQSNNNNNNDDKLRDETSTTKVGSLLNSGFTKTANFLGRTFGSTISDGFLSLSNTVGTGGASSSLSSSIQSAQHPPRPPSSIGPKSSDKESFTCESSSPQTISKLKKKGVFNIRLQAYDTFNAHTDEITCLSVVQNKTSSSINNFIVCSISKDSSMKSFNISMNDGIFHLQRTFSITGTEFTSCSLTSDSKFALVAGNDNHVYSYSILNACAIGKKLVHDDSISCTSYIADASKLNSLYGTDLLLTSSFDGSVKLWKIQPNNLLNNEPLAEYESIENICIHIVVLKDNIQMAAIGTDQGQLLIWSISTNRIVLSTSISRNKCPITGILWTNNDKLICTTKDGVISYINLSPSAIASVAMGFNTVLATNTIDTEIYCITSMQDHEDELTLFCGCYDGSIRVYSFCESEMKEMYRFPRAHECTISSIRIIPLKKSEEISVIISGGINGTLRACLVVREI